MSKTIRLTIRPGDEVTVSDTEYAQLLRMGLVVGEAAPGPADPQDAEVAAHLNDETSATYTALLSQLAAATAGDNAFSTAQRAAFGTPDLTAHPIHS